MTSARDLLADIGENVRESFAKNKRVMSFPEYLELAAQNPTVQLRSAPQYILDCFDYYGADEVEYPWGKVKRFRLFDCPWADGRDRLIGQEQVQNRVYRSLANFVREGTANKLVLLHGPNGSAKSTLIRCIGRAMQHYSGKNEGALYKFNWIFPAQKSTRAGIGFSGGSFDEASASDTFAYLPDEMVDAKLPDELHDHPILLLPPEQRAAFLAEALPEGDDFVLSDYIQFGQLSHKNKTIYEALLASYQGDYLKVLRHVQVERFYVQHRYRTGYVTVEPQLSVDANERQVTVDRSVSALPAALQSISLFEYSGELVNANRGMIEYSDLLKRPLEAYKYLITTVERASVTLNTATLYLDMIFLGSSNEIHLAAFKEIPEFQSFKGRLELVRVPYLLDFAQEEQIYAQKIREAAGQKHVAPHCAYVAALWSVLTRMRKPQGDRYPTEVSELVARLTPLEKAELYAQGQAPEHLSNAESKELLAHLRDLWHESDSYPNYEGRIGASPRELLVAIFNAADAATYAYVSPLAILDQIEELTKQVSVYDFLKQETLPGGYHDHKKFIELVRERLIDCIDDEVRVCLGLVEETEYHRVFERYISHVMHWTKKEKVVNPTTGETEDPDENLMGEVERTLEMSGDNESFRHDLISKIGAWALDHPSTKPDYTDIFADHFKKLKRAYYEEQRKPIRRGIEDILAHLIDGKTLEGEARVRTEETLEQMQSRYGYNEDSARDLVSLLYRARYGE